MKIGLRATLMAIVLVLTGSLFVTRSFAQLANPNAAGVSMGHIHLNVADLDASKKLFLAIGGAPVKMATTEGIKFPGVIVWLRKADASGPMEGSSVDHIGFLVKDSGAVINALKQQGVRTEPNGSKRGAFVFSPEGVKIEIAEKSDLQVPAQFDEIAFQVADPAPDGGKSWSEQQAWYGKIFGAASSKPTPPASGQSSVPGVTLQFVSVPAATVATKGRALDHIGFEVKNLEAFCKMLEASGIKLDRAYAVLPVGVSYAFVTDPWGTYIELNEGLDKL